MQLSKGQNTHQAVSAHEACNIKIINNKQNNYCQLIKKKASNDKSKGNFPKHFLVKAQSNIPDGIVYRNLLAFETVRYQ